MGAQMEAGNAKIFTKRECWLVAKWCDQFDRDESTPEQRRDSRGVFDISASLARETDAGLPTDFEAAHAAGFPVEDRDTFDRARAFLAAAVNNPDGITGSY